jgi:Tfp pilus assembly protein PilF/glutathione synthase/RimK-type ligase-like ATP-grasp enzyme
MGPPQPQRDPAPPAPQDSDDIDRLFERATLLERLGRSDEARDAYVAVIKRDRSHLGALGNLGTLLYSAGYRDAARLTFGEALKHHPNDLRMLANFGHALYENAQYAEARVVYMHAFEVDPAYAPAHQGISHVLERLGESEAALVHRRKGFTALPISVRPYRGASVPISVLVLSSVHHGNVPIDAPLDDRTFLTIRLFTDYYDPTLPLPPHDAIFNAIGDADRCQESLAAAERLLQARGETAINSPAAVRETGRVQIAERLRRIDGLVVPQIRELSRDELTTIERFPVLLRPPGYHTGECFERANDREEFTRLAASMPGERLLVIEMLDARGRDGLYRKYRVLVIGGTLYPVHLARSSTWKVHYFSADQARTPDAMAEERAFLTDMRSTLGPRAMAALEEAARRIGLDYFGIDFGLDIQGNALFFEANATMRADDPGATAALRELVLRAARTG